MSLVSDKAYFQVEVAPTLINVFQAIAKSRFAEVDAKMTVAIRAQIAQMVCTAERVSIGLLRQHAQCREQHLMSVKLIMNVRTINSAGMQVRHLRRLEVNYA